ncbi:MAG: hypothetical protein COA58_05725, partial [Bacteroidetes bacterium]
TGTAAKFNRPSGLAFDASGNVYVGDYYNHKIRKITPGGVVSTLAGSSSGFANGTGNSAKFFSPFDVAVDGNGNVYVGDYNNNKIRKITSAGVVTTFAGSTAGYADGTGAAAQFYKPLGVAVDASGNVYVGDGFNHRIRKITPAGVVTTLAGSSQGDADGTGSVAQFYRPYFVVLDPSGKNLYVGDYYNNKIKKITLPVPQIYYVSTLAGSSQGYVNGTGIAAKFYGLFGVTVDTTGNVYVADAFNHRIRRITPAGVVTTFAGSSAGSADGTGTAAQFNDPRGVAVDASGNVYVADRRNHNIRKISPAGVVTTLAGNSGSAGSADGTGSSAQFRYPHGVAVDVNGNVYVADHGNHRIRKITPAGVVTTFAGSSQGYADGTGIAAKFNSPNGVAVDASGNVYVADVLNSKIRKISPAGVVTTFADTSTLFGFPGGVAVDACGNVYIGDNATVRKITPTGAITTLAGSSQGYADGTGSAARFNAPYGVAVDASGNVYVADYVNAKIRKMTHYNDCSYTGILPAEVSTTYKGFYTSTDTNGWTHYCSEGEELLLSLKIGTSGAVVAADEVELKTGANKTYSYLGADGGMISTRDKGYAMMDRRWDVDPTTQPSSGTVGVRYYFSQEEYDSLASKLLVHGTAGAWKSTLSSVTELSMYKATSGAAYANPHTTNGIIILNGSTPNDSTWTHSTFHFFSHQAEFTVSSFSGGGAGSGGGGGAAWAPLPVELIHFTAQAISNTSARLDWATASELNNSHFNIQRSYDGVNFEFIGKLLGNGNSNEVLTYSYLDKDIALGTQEAYYRLLQVDYNGAQEYSEIRVVLFNQDIDKQTIHVYPNPFTSQVYVNVSGISESDISISVLNIEGKEVIQREVLNVQGLQKLDLSHLDSGMYFITISSASGSQQVKIIKR